MKMAEATIEITCGGVMPTVGGASAHVDLAKVKTDLPAFVNTIRKHGLKVRQIRGGGQTAVDAERRGAGRHDGPARRDALLARHGQLRLVQADRAAARRDQSQSRAVREAEPEARHDAHVSHARGRELRRIGRVGSALRDEGLRSEVRRAPLGYGPHVASRQQYVGAADANGGAVRRRDGLERSHVGAESRLPR